MSATGNYTGTPAKCVIVVTKTGDALSDSDARLMMAHEAWHCYQGVILGLQRDWFDRPAPWITEGQAEWVGDLSVPTAPIASEAWPGYLPHPEKPLFQFAYAAVGFYSQLDSSGTDTWASLKPMLDAKDNESAFVASGASSDAFLDRWASGFLRDSTRGDPWQITGPAITSDQALPGGISLGNGGSVGEQVAPYANEISIFKEQPDVLDASISGHARLSDANGHDYLVQGDGQFCMLDAGCACPGRHRPADAGPRRRCRRAGSQRRHQRRVGHAHRHLQDDFCSKGVTGTWEGTWINSPDFGTPQATGGFTMTLTQKGTSFTGTVSVTGPTCVRDGTVNGTVTGGNVQFGWITDVARPVQFTGSVGANTMSGTYSAISCPPLAILVYGDWTAQRTSKATTKP